MTTEQKTVLVNFGEHNRQIIIPPNADLLQYVLDEYEDILEKSDFGGLQIYSKKWEEFVDLKQTLYNTVSDSSKLKIILKGREKRSAESDLEDMPNEEAFEDLVSDFQHLRLKEHHQHRTFAAVLPNEHLPNHSTLTKRNLSVRSQSSQGSDYDTGTPHCYLTFPACPVKVSDAKFDILEDWFNKWFTEFKQQIDCLRFIKAVSDGIEKEKYAINALCMFGLQHIITEADMNCWTFETQFQLYNELPKMLVSTKFQSDNCIGVGKEKEFIPLKGGLGLKAPEGCSICSNILQTYQGNDGFYKMTGGPHSIPVMPIEILSLVCNSLDASFRATLQKCALGCFETFRIARNFNNTVKEWSGFVFPSDSACPVVKVTIKPKGDFGIAYRADYEVLKLNNVREKMLSSFQLQNKIMEEGHRLLQKHSSPSPFSYVLKLSEEEVTECGNYFYSSIFGHENPVEFKCYQIPSAFAYVFCLIANKKIFYLKCFINPADSDSLDNVEATLLDVTTTSFAPFCLSEEKKIVLMDQYKFYYFKALPPPLNVYQAKICLKQFVQAVSKSLKVLHKIYRHAHTDVRLENICFQCSHGKPPIAIFIDLDRCCLVNHKVNEKWFKKTNDSTALYIKGFTNARIDWRQLGCTVYWILKATSLTAQDVKSIHDLKVDDVTALNYDLASCNLDTDSISFVIKLINEGVCDDRNVDRLFSQFTTPINDVRQIAGP